MLQRVFTGARRLFDQGIDYTRYGWRWYRVQSRKKQILIAAVAALLLIALIALTNLLGGKPVETEAQGRAVELQTVGSLSGTGGQVEVIGTVRSVTEANILAQTGGTVRSVRTKLGATVPAGFIIAELENAAERASVLQAQGVYEAALASRAITIRQAENTGESLAEAEVSSRNTYRTSFTAIETALENQVDTFFGGNTPVGPDLLINPGPGPVDALSRARADINIDMRRWREHVATADARDAEPLLAEAEQIVRKISNFLNQLSLAANRTDSRATAAQLTALASARTTVDSQLAAISAARTSYRAAATAADVAETQTESTSSEVASADAGVKQALGALRGTQANLERTVIRAPIGGQVNFLPIRVGDYVTAFTHAATVAQNGALEIITYVSEGDRELLAAGSRVRIEDTHSGIVTSISPALDPVTKQIEVRVAVDAASGLVNGQSVRVSFEDILAAPSPTVSAGPVLLPLSAVKLRSNERIVFTVDEEHRLVANPVEIGDVRGDRIEILTSLPKDMRIVTDARGLSEGQKVRLAADSTL
jgi:HlyD family secretion protein